MWFPRCIFLHWISASVTGFVLEFGDKLGGVVHLWKQSQWVFGMQPRVSILLMEEILHQLIGSLSHYLKGFLHPRWLFGISSINSMSRLFGHLFIASWCKLHRSIKSCVSGTTLGPGICDWLFLVESRNHPAIAQFLDHYWCHFVIPPFFTPHWNLSEVMSPMIKVGCVLTWRSDPPPWSPGGVGCWGS